MNQATSTTRSSNIAADTAFINKVVRAIMLRHGVTERQHSNKLSEILGLSYSQAHRIINGGDWTVRQLSAVAEYFGETLSSLIGERESPASSPIGQDEVEAHDAILVLGTYQLLCRVWIGDPLFHLPRNVEYVALESEGAWRVVEATASPESGLIYKVEKIEVAIKKPDAPSIAIVDDDENSANNLRDFLNESGFDATAFYDLSTVEHAIQERKFDGFVVDWYLCQRTAESLIKQIRSFANPSVPILLLTGEVQTGRAQVSDVARIIRQFDVIYQDKPIKLPIIAAELSKAMGY